MAVNFLVPKTSSPLVTGKSIFFSPRSSSLLTEQSNTITSSSSSDQTRKVVVVADYLDVNKSSTGGIIPKAFLDESSYSDNMVKLSLKDYLDRSKDLIRSDGGGGPPRWFSPLDCGKVADNLFEDSPLLLYLPGLDGVGLGLIMHHHRLGKIFDVWCLHIPVMDRTSFKDLLQIVERTIKSENSRSPNRPIYLVGESLGGCVALAVAARNPNIDLKLILANPATSFDKSLLHTLLPFLEVIPDNLNISLPYFLGLVTGDPLKMATTAMVKGLPLQQTSGQLSEKVAALLPSLYVLADILPNESLLWKLQMLKSASSFTNSRLHAIKAEVLILASGRDHLLPSLDEAGRLLNVLSACQIRHFPESGHALFMEDGFDLVTVTKGAGFYRRKKHIDYVSDFMLPTHSEFQKACESYRWVDIAASPVMHSTLENGKIVKGLAGIPCEGPVVFVGYHMLLGLELGPLVIRLLSEKNILLRGIAHPLMFGRVWEQTVPDSSSFDVYRTMGAVPVSATNFYKLLSRKSHVLLYPGGVREALHRKGEAHKLFWPNQSEFVRMAARFGAKIVPFGVVGEDDLFDVVADYDDLKKIPFLKAQIEELNDGRTRRLRSEFNGEVAEEDLHLPGVLPKIPGRFYFLFGKPIETEGRKKELRDREKAHELYMHVKSQVEGQISYLKEKREKDPYRSLLSRLVYQAIHGHAAEIPTFEL